MLCARAGPEDSALAIEHLHAAGDLADRLGMSTLATRLGQVAASTRG
jgi:hypothetical protein